MSSEWQEATWGDIATLEYGKSIRDYKNAGGDFPVYGTNGPIGWHHTPLCPCAGIVIGRKGAYRGVHYSQIPFFVIDTAFYLKPKIGLNIKWAYYSILTYDINGMDSGSAIPSTSRDDFYQLPVRIPSLSEQQQVAETLGALDDRITLLRETNATLEAIAQAMFKSWFVDFDPVRAKAEGLEPEGLDAATVALFPDSFEESELGLVPRGWKLVPFGKLLIHTIGGDWGDETPSEKNDTRVAIIRGTDIPDLQSGAANRVPLRYTSTKKLATRKLQDGDLVLEVSGGSKDQPTGRALYLTEALLGQFDCPVEPASFCRLLRPIDRNIGLLLAQHLTYIYGIGKTWEYQNQSTGIANFQTTHFLESELVAVPPREVLVVFADVMRSIVDRGHLSQIQSLASLRDTLLPRLISGQLRLPEAEVMVEDVCA